MSFSSGTSPHSPARSRRTAAAAGAVVALGIGTLVVLPGSGEAGTVAPTELVSASVARSSSALSRSLGAQSRTVGSASTVPAVVAAPASVAAGTAYPVLKPGARVPAVKTLQAKLGIKQTGWYGPMTLAAVVAFQKSRGLPAQGHVGMRTWNALISGVKPAAVAKPAAVTTTAKKAAAAPASRTTVRATVTAGRVCPAPGASFGDGWGVARGSRSHKGMDMSGRMGSPILAIEAGVVIREGRQRNGALRIVLQGRSGSKFYYGHMSKDLVRAGSRVTRGQVIALMGDTGSPGQVHLHFEYWKSGGESAAVNPASLLRSLC